MSHATMKKRQAEGMPLKSDIRRDCQSATKGVVRRSRKPHKGTGRKSRKARAADARREAVAKNGTPKPAPRPEAPPAPAIEPTDRSGGPSPSTYVLANRVGRKLEFSAPNEDDARAQAVAVGLVRKPENARLIEAHP